MPVCLSRDHGDVPSHAVKAIAHNLIDNLQIQGSEEDEGKAQEKSVKMYLEQQVCPFQLNSNIKFDVRKQD